MKKTVLITGASSGIGRETAVYFASKGWNIVATMRRPEKRKVDFAGHSVDTRHLDVLDKKSVRDAVAYTVKKYGRIDVLVNNAGYAVRGVFEASTPEEVKKQYDTNVIGLLDVCREALPVLRRQKGGTIVNLASIGGKISFPLYTLYNSTKWAVEGFSEGLRYELMPFNIRVKVIEPGMIKTDFYERSMVLSKKKGLTAYDAFVKRSLDKMGVFERINSHPRVIAKLIYRAAKSSSRRLRYYGGSNAHLLLALRRVLPERFFLFIIRAFCG